MVMPEDGPPSFLITQCDARQCSGVSSVLSSDDVALEAIQIDVEFRPLRDSGFRG